MKLKTSFIGILFLVFALSPVLAQISPGDLAEVHAHLEGMSKCTLCHTLGDKVTNKKCLDCHVLLKNRITANKGFHISSEVSKKSCVECHNDHNGRKFQIIRFDKNTFDHQKTGYQLEGAHARKKCVDCHVKKNISDEKVKEKKFTFLGLKTDCKNCHEDYHQASLSEKCSSCHDMEAFKPASGFDHNKADYHLNGKHKDVACEKCHPREMRNGKKFQKFAGVKSTNCTDCHKDVHENKFGQNCSSCHTEISFNTIKETSNFDHSKTNYPLQGKHRKVECKSCHKNKLTDALAHNACKKCHVDYHKGQFKKQNHTPDCSTCHSVNGFKESSFSIEKHQESNFKLEGSHLATPCFACHLKQKRWEFKQKGLNCTECHENIHKEAIDPKYYPENNCRSCHEVSLWKTIDFDHSKTKFELQGAHKEKTCRSCHFIETADKKTDQKFTGLSAACNTCHTDIHQNQFEVDGETNCTRCHAFNQWKDVKFDHSKTRFPLEGKHQNLKCDQCHKSNTDGPIAYTIYKINHFKCKDCH